MATPSTTAPRDPATGADSATRRRVMAAAVVVLLAGSAVAVVSATTIMPESYSWVRHSVSESAGQGVRDAWVARSGFLLLGFAVLVLAGIAASRWGPVATVLFRVYGISMIATAAFAHRPWLDVPYDIVEDNLHSLTATVVGFTFTIGVLLVAIGRGPGTAAARTFDAAAVISALVISLMVVNVTGLSGLAQRVMFGIGYVWFGLEAIRSARDARRRAMTGTVLS
jgi:hypothetical protein